MYKLTSKGRFKTKYYIKRYISYYFVVRQALNSVYYQQYQQTSIHVYCVFSYFIQKLGIVYIFARLARQIYNCSNEVSKVNLQMS